MGNQDSINPEGKMHMKEKSPRQMPADYKTVNTAREFIEQG